MWSRRYDKCIVCGTSEVRHEARGMCKRCYVKKWAEDNPGKCKEIKIRFKENNPGYFNESSKKFRKANPEKVKESSNRYRELNLKECRERCRIYRRLNLEKCKKYLDEWKKKNPEKVKESKLEWNKNNCEKVKEYARKSSKKWRLLNPEKHKEKTRKWAKEHPEEIKEFSKKWRKKNIDKVRKSQKRYYKFNKDKINKHRRYYCNKKYRSDPMFRLKTGISKSIGLRLKQCLSSKKNISAWTYLPYTPEELMLHLEKQFWEGMTRKNYGEWQIDHKVPHSSFCYKSISLGDEEFQKCWALSNLQPLWAKDNLLKSNKLIYN